jgi:uncharacterized protein with ParB-like and HNH nuclease domain
VQASPAKVIEYFNGEKQNLIPLFQRKYTWAKKDWQVLWEDLLVQYELPENSTHFMGAVVSLPARSVPVGVSKYLIIDGQQRLSTISILLCALRDELDPTNASRIQEVYLTNRYRSPEDLLKLVPTQADRDAYRALVIDRDAGTHSGLIVDAYRYFRQMIDNARDSDDAAISCEKLLSTVEHNLQVVMINLDEVDDPYLIFESLNAKGEPLTQADLVRNYVLMRFRHSISSGGEQERIYTQYWRPLEEMLGINMTEFLRHDSMKNGENIREGGIYAAIKLIFKDKEPDAVESLLRQMRSAGSIYQRIVSPEHETNEAIRRRLENLNELKIRVSYPLILRLFQSHYEGQLNMPDLERCLLFIEALSIRRSVCGVPTNGLNKLFLQWCKNYPDSDHLNWFRKALASGSGGSRFPGDVEFADQFTSQPQYGRGATSYVLRSLEESFEHHEPVILNGPTIEHVMPQSITDDWKIMLGNEWEATHASYLHTIGNLTLTGYNPELGNLSFPEKKAILGNTHVELSRSIVEQDVWTAVQIRQRGEMLSAKALSIWPRPMETS